MFDVSIADRPDRQLAALGHTGPYLEVGSKFEQLGAIVATRNLFPSVRGMVGIYYDDPNAVAEKDLRSHACFQLADGTPVPDDLEAISIDGGKTAVLLFKGPYAGLKGAYDFLFGAWLPKSGETPRNQPSYEVYLNNPAETAPEDLLTEICLPLA